MTQSNEEVAKATRAYLKKLMLKVSLLRIQAGVTGEMYDHEEIDLMPMSQVVDVLERIANEYKELTANSATFNYTDSQQRERIRRVMDDLGSMEPTPINVDTPPSVNIS